MKYFIFFFILFYYQALAQTYRLEESFEETGKLYSGEESINSLLYVFSPNNSSPDFYSEKFNRKKINSLPNTDRGRITPKDGKSLIGLILYSSSLSSYKEYISRSVFLEKGKKYRITISLHEGSATRFKSKNVGVLLSTENPSSYNVGNDNRIPAKPQIVFNEIASADSGWREYTQEIIVDSTYNYITIGSFDSTDVKYEIKQYDVLDTYAYLFLDLLTIQELDYIPPPPSPKEPVLTLLDSSHIYLPKEKHVQAKLKFKADSLVENTTYSLLADEKEVKVLKTKKAQNSIEFEINQEFLLDTIDFQIIEKKERLKSNIVKIKIPMPNGVVKINSIKAELKEQKSKDSTLINLKIDFELKAKVASSTSFDVFLLYEGNNKDTIRIENGIVQEKAGSAKKDSLPLKNGCYDVVVYNDSIKQIGEDKFCVGKETIPTPPEKKDSLKVNVKIVYGEPNTDVKSINVRGFWVETITPHALSESEEIENKLTLNNQIITLESLIKKNDSLSQWNYLPRKLTMLEDSVYLLESKSTYSKSNLAIYTDSIKVINEAEIIKFRKFSFDIQQVRKNFYEKDSTKLYTDAAAYTSSKNYTPNNTYLKIHEIYLEKDYDDEPILYIKGDSENEVFFLGKLSISSESNKTSNIRFKLPPNLKKNSIFTIEIMGGYLFEDEIHSFIIDKEGNISIPKK